MIGNTERSGFGGKISNLVSDVHIECEVPLNCQNGAIKEIVYVKIWMSEGSWRHMCQLRDNNQSQETEGRCTERLKSSLSKSYNSSHPILVITSAKPSLLPTEGNLLLLCYLSTSHLLCHMVITCFCVSPQLHISPCKWGVFCMLSSWFSSWLLIGSQ